ncbi:MAG: formyltetrahydrofolate deformylase [Steroidobacteraceae bacterium]|jgi:formyltetrahydrofolate deformylase|nr:formyltetrahydrofolate deformylase [Steroidobacteraceae bacterium]
MTGTSFVLRLSCPDRVGVVAAVTSYLAGRGANILEAHHFLDPVAGRSMLRLVFAPGRPGFDRAAFEAEFGESMRPFGMEWTLRDLASRVRVVVAVSRQSHCLMSLLHRWSAGTLPIDVAAVVSNHEDQRRLAEWHGLPFHHLPIEGGRKEAQEQQMLALFRDYGGELLVLARYMQILTPAACRELEERAINIHHSFLPGFKGARPYHQAYQRGVKLIGATAHYVTDDLDEGPIIEQAVERVDHSFTPEQLTTIGNEIESVVLNRAVQWHAESRVFRFGNRTVVLR